MMAFSGEVNVSKVPCSIDLMQLMCIVLNKWLTYIYKSLFCVRLPKTTYHNLSLIRWLNPSVHSLHFNN